MNSGPSVSPWWAPDRHADRRIFLQKRASITHGLRGWFQAAGFTEVETSALVVSPGNETHLHAPEASTTGADGGQRRRRYLRTSPEFACKKLLAAGERRIVEFARVFRDRERGALHLGEFTMLEWYRANEPYDAIIADTLAVIALAARTGGVTAFNTRGRSADPFSSERVTVAEAFKRHAGIDLRATYGVSGTNRDALAKAATARGIGVAADDTWSDIFSKVLVEKVEPQLGQGRLTVLDAYPLPEAALARPNAFDLLVAERFEVYACGVELANGFGELTDAAEQRRRFTAAMDEKERRYGERYPLDEEFLAALEQMPQASGVALGFDRLVMLATGAQRLDQVVWTPQNDT